MGIRSGLRLLRLRTPDSDETKTSIEVDVFFSTRRHFFVVGMYSQNRDILSDIQK